MLDSILKKIFGDPNEKELKQIKVIVDNSARFVYIDKYIPRLADSRTAGHVALYGREGSRVRTASQTERSTE